MEEEREEKLLMELRSQANSLLAAAQLLTPLVREQGAKRDEKALAHLNQGLYRMVRTVNHLDLCQNLDVAFYPREIDLGGLCRDIGREVEGIAPDLGVSFWWEIGKEGLLSLADEVLLEQAILNMLTNAFQHAGRGGHVKLKCMGDRDRFTVTVQDDGDGLSLPDPDANPLLKRPGGVGMGLEAARRVASLHGGVLVLENGDPGVRAVLSIPIRRAGEEERLREGKMRFDRTGGFSQLLVEFSHLLPAERYNYGDVE